MEIGFNPLVRKIVNCPKPVVNAINGISAGGGVGLALCGDLIIASESAKFKLVFGPQLGIISDVGASWLIPNLLGRARANGMALLGEDIDSSKALNWGLVWEVVPDNDLKDKAIEYAKNESEVLVIDEIGKFTVESEMFVNCVRGALEIDKPTLLTLHKKSRHPLLQDIRRRDDGRILEVTPVNRALLPYKIHKLMRETY